MKVKIKIKQKLKVMYKDCQSSLSVTINIPGERTRPRGLQLPQSLDLQKFQAVVAR